MQRGPEVGASAKRQPRTRRCAASSSPAGDIHSADTSGNSRQQRLRIVRRHHQQRFRQRFRRGAARRDDRDRRCALRPARRCADRGFRRSCRPSVANGSGFCCDVDIDMSRSSSVSLPLRPARRAPSRRCARPIRLSGRRADRADRAAARVDHRRADAVRLQHLERAIDGVALADPAEIDREAVDRKWIRSGASSAILSEPTHRLRRRDLVIRRTAAIGVRLLPGAQQRRDGDVERPARAARPRDRLFDDVVEARVDGDEAAAASRLRRDRSLSSLKWLSTRSSRSISRIARSAARAPSACDG